MATTQEKSNTNTGKNATAITESDPRSKDPRSKIDPKAPAGSENSLGAESVRDGRPATDDSTVEAMDEESPDVTGTLDTDTAGGSK
jgi:hypothetical protein